MAKTYTVEVVGRAAEFTVNEYVTRTIVRANGKDCELTVALGDGCEAMQHFSRGRPWKLVLTFQNRPKKVVQKS